MTTPRTALPALLFVLLAACGTGGLPAPEPGPELLSTDSFVHLATPANTTGRATRIDHPLTNGDPNAFLIVTQNWGAGISGALVTNARNVGVAYESGQWAIVNQDGTAMPDGAHFNVTVSKGAAAGPTAFALHVATAGNTTAHMTQIDHARTNGQPSAHVLVTANLTPGGAAERVDDHVVGVGYVDSVDAWVLFHEDEIGVPAGAAFNIAVVEVGPDSPFSATMTRVEDGTSPHTYTTPVDISDDLHAVVHATPVYLGVPGAGVLCDHPFGVFITEEYVWYVFNEDHADMPLGAAFHVALAVP